MAKFPGILGSVNRILPCFSLSSLLQQWINSYFFICPTSTQIWSWVFSTMHCSLPKLVSFSNLWAAVMPGKIKNPDFQGLAANLLLSLRTIWKFRNQVIANGYKASLSSAVFIISEEYSTAPSRIEKPLQHLCLPVPGPRFCSSSSSVCCFFPFSVVFFCFGFFPCKAFFLGSDFPLFLLFSWCSARFSAASLLGSVGFGA